ncbi:MAG: 50S ribosomal protein L24e [Candidatus Pacearchaeota archaeon]
MPECSFCKKQYDVPRGLTFVLSSGEILYFCSSKCRKNYKLGRTRNKVPWIRKKKK